MDKQDSFIPNDDIEFEEELRKKEQDAKDNAARQETMRIEAEKSEREQYEKELQDKKLELIKLKQGVIESSETVKEVHEEQKKLSFGEWLENVWYRSKWLIVFVVFLVFTFGYIIYDDVTRVNPDFTVLAIMDNNSLYIRNAELEDFIKEYAEDVNGDGEVNIVVFHILTDLSDASTVTSQQAQIMTQLQSGENMIVISDGTTDFIPHNYVGELDGECVTENGIRLNCELTREKLKWQAMPDELYISIREPAKLFSTTEEEMQKNFDLAEPTYLRIYEAIAGSK